MEIDFFYFCLVYTNILKFKTQKTFRGGVIKKKLMSTVRFLCHKYENKIKKNNEKLKTSNYNEKEQNWQIKT